MAKPSSRAQSRGQDSARFKGLLEALHREEQLRIAELCQKSQLRVQLRLLNLVEIYQPKLLVGTTASNPARKPNSGATELEWVWDPLVENVEATACPQCHHPTFELSLTRQGGLACPASPPPVRPRPDDEPGVRRGRNSGNSGGIPVSEYLFAWRTTTTARLTDDTEAMGNNLDPVLCTVGPATAHRRPYAIQLLGRLFPTDLPSPAGPTFRLSATELLPFRERVQDGIGMPGAMAAVARPGIFARIGHHRGPHGVGLDVPQNDEQVVAVLDDRGSEAALPDVAAGSLSPVVPPGVSDGQGLEDAADRLPGGRLEKQMKMVGHQAVAEERERVPCLGAGEIAKEHIPFAVGAEDIGSVVPAVDRVVNKVIACRSWKSSHESNLPT